jgi:hypothetical protein
MNNQMRVDNMERDFLANCCWEHYRNDDKSKVVDWVLERVKDGASWPLPEATNYLEIRIRLTNHSHAETRPKFEAKFVARKNTEFGPSSEF